MILSHQYKFIFLKTSKTAGTSVEIALSKFLGPKDVITPISPEDEVTRRDLGYRGPQNYRSKFWEYSYADLVKLVSKGEWKEKFYNHISAFQVRGLVGEQVWNTYFTFCIERNPWDRVISHY